MLSITVRTAHFLKQRLAFSHCIRECLPVEHNQRVASVHRPLLDDIPVLHYTTPIEPENIHDSRVPFLRWGSLLHKHPPVIITQAYLRNRDIQCRDVFAQSIRGYLTSGFEVGIVLDVRFSNVIGECGGDVLLDIKLSDECLEDVKLFEGGYSPAWTVCCRGGQGCERERGEECTDFHVGDVVLAGQSGNSAILGVYSKGNRM